MKKHTKKAFLSAGEAFKGPKVKLILSISLALLVITFIIPFWKLYPEIATKPAVPLHYNIHFGVDLFGAWWRVFMPSMVGLAILIVNFALAASYWKSRKMLSYYALLATPALMTFLILASLFITLLNITYD
ncbi:hypothetical protein HN358_04190 [Candidatus Uhrbacteria bacterium]|jgi:hypothetical protein|nr:hypothetical protein [Candidatus Uhrbacteria bacterium]MBT7716959.1 hypothetical protein [Candidatus Uhrbacteria bacterium]